MNRLLLLLLALFTCFQSFSQSDCPYPIIFVHGWNSTGSAFSSVYTDTDFVSAWGPIADTFHAVLNATTQSRISGADGILGNADDDVLVSFTNESNIMSPGCVYAINFENFWNEDQSNPVLFKNSGDTPSFFDSDGNEASALKQGYALGQMIEQVLAANPGKDKVILVGHSMGGLASREYLQRRSPEQPTGIPRWWVNPSQADGHRVAKLVTTGTPHLGSNFFGNSSLAPTDSTEDTVPDLASEGVRDLRYSYSCGFLNLSDCPGVYLYGGNENDFSSFPFPYWSEDVDCDGDETSSNVIGINITGQAQGSGPDEWDGTYANPQLPLPSDIRYTWITSNNQNSGGDDIVDLDRQWLYNGNTPMPSDGVAFRRTDTLLADVTHTALNSDLSSLIQGLDEGDYPLYAYPIKTLSTYAGMAQVRSVSAPFGTFTDDPDWYALEVSTASGSQLTISLAPTSGLAGRIDFFTTAPTDFDNSNSPIFVQFPAGTPLATLAVPVVLTPGMYYLRVQHDAVTKSSWTDPYELQTTFTTFPVEWLSFSGEEKDGHILLTWSTARESDNLGYEVEVNTGNAFEPIGFVAGSGTSGSIQQYRYEWPQASPGTYLFRLKQIDYNGQFSYSSQVEVTVTNRPEVGINLQENGLELTVGTEQTLTWQVMDAMGRVIASQSRELLSTGTHHFPIGQLASGQYIVNVRGTDFQMVKRIMLMK